MVGGWVYTAVPRMGLEYEKLVPVGKTTLK